MNPVLGKGVGVNQDEVEFEALLQSDGRVAQGPDTEVEEEEEIDVNYLLLEYL